MALMQAGRVTGKSKSKFPFKQIFPSVHHTMVKLVQLNLKVLTNISISANFRVFVIFKEYPSINKKQCMQRKIAISAICLITFRPRRDQLVPKNYFCKRYPVVDYDKTIDIPSPMLDPSFSLTWKNLGH